MAPRDWAEKDYYAVLGVSKDATKADIKKAYRKLAQRYHPDANEGDASAEARFKEISEAHSILANDDKRAEYDQLRQLIEAGGQRFYGFDPGGGGNVRVNIGDLFGGGGGGGFEDIFGFRSQPRRGSDMESAATLSFDEAVAGTTVVLTDGTKVRIPPGVNDGSRIKVAGKGGSGQGAVPGDLYVRVTVTPHPVFELGKGGNLTVRLPLTYEEATLGAKVEVPTLDAPVTVKIPPGTQPGKVLRVKGRGSAHGSGGRGDLLVRVELAVPQKVSRQEKDLMEQLASARKDSPRKHLDPYLDRKAAAS